MSDRDAAEDIAALVISLGGSRDLAAAVALSPEATRIYAAVATGSALPVASGESGLLRLRVAQAIEDSQYGRLPVKADPGATDGR